MTPERLYDLFVMLCRLTNMPAVFQYLLPFFMALNQKTSQTFVAVNTDEDIVFSPSLTEQFKHL